jgi:hypothetical protein
MCEVPTNVKGELRLSLSPGRRGKTKMGFPIRLEVRSTKADLGLTSMPRLARSKTISDRVLLTIAQSASLVFSSLELIAVSLLNAGVYEHHGNGTEGSNPIRSATQSGMQRNRAALLQESLKSPQFCSFRLHLALEKCGVKSRRLVFGRFSLEGTHPVLFPRIREANARRSQADNAAKAP